ncbi:MAG TPA: hypothetical protein VFR90_13520 [Methylibium sp.]|uniref:hypothetical protein n=1 Tax=Methylibium sp. TaxID=2067992 RepID=UPI002DB81327|nr:hypothetical protein [Methylibium sp.]HEU4460136.1 hypothetical protein [Methylibium sp.]
MIDARIDFTRAPLDGAPPPPQPLRGLSRTLGWLGLALLVSAPLVADRASGDADAADADAPPVERDTATMPEAAEPATVDLGGLWRALAAAMPAGAWIERIELQADPPRLALHARASDATAAAALSTALAGQPLLAGLRLVQHDSSVPTEAEAAASPGALRAGPALVFEGRLARPATDEDGR